MLKAKLFAVLCAVMIALLAVAFAQSGDDPEPNEEALAAAQAVTIPDGLTDAEAEIYRQGYALGYYMALHPRDSLGEYVLNTNSHRFHYPSCQSAASIAPNNRSVFHGSRDELIAQGYKPCGVCNP